MTDPAFQNMWMRLRLAVGTSLAALFVCTPAWAEDCAIGYATCNFGCTANRLGEACSQLCEVTRASCEADAAEEQRQEQQAEEQRRIDAVHEAAQAQQAAAQALQQAQVAAQQRAADAEAKRQQEEVQRAAAEQKQATFQQAITAMTPPEGLRNRVIIHQHLLEYRPTEGSSEFLRRLQKDKFETTAQYKLRVVKERLPYTIEVTVRDYDADTGRFVGTVHSEFGEVPVFIPMPPAAARLFVGKPLLKVSGTLKASRERFLEFVTPKITPYPSSGQERNSGTTGVLPSAGSSKSFIPSGDARHAYLLGLSLGEQFHSAGVSQDLPLDSVTRGVGDGLHGKKSTADENQEMKAYMHSISSTAQLQSGDDRHAYLLGISFGEQLHLAGVPQDLPLDVVTRGVGDGLRGKKSTPDDKQQLQDYVHSIDAALSVRNRSASRDFLVRNGSEPGVHTTPTGLQYRILAPGASQSRAIELTDEVTVNYRGKLLDGTEFDSSYARGQPASFKVNRVILGWQEALILMSPGAKWELFVPPDLAYKDSHVPSIPPGSLLIFDVDLLSARPSQ